VNGERFWYESARSELAPLEQLRTRRLLARVDISYARHLASRSTDPRFALEEALGAAEPLIAREPRDAALLRLRADARLELARWERRQGRPWREHAAQAVADYDAALRLVASDVAGARGRKRAERLLASPSASE